MQHVSGLKCLVCGKDYKIGEIDYVCPDHGDEGLLDVCYDYELIRRNFLRDDLLHAKDRRIWRYLPLLPINPDSMVPPLDIGWTPLYPAHGLAAELGLKCLWIKDDGCLPTASYKDRASAIGVIKAQESGATVMTTASTGNAAAALSGLCASVGMPNVIFVPETAPPAKIAQLLVYGSRVVLVEGTYDDAFDLCIGASRRYGWYNRNSGYNPYMTEGKKTGIFEICEQLAWDVPDRIFVSVGDGSIIGGLHKGLKDLLALRWIDKLPKLMGVQAAGSGFVYSAWKNNESVLTKPPISARTVADSICSGLPRDRIRAMAAVKETGGAYIAVEDEDILKAIPHLARQTGIFAEPAGAAAFAGMVQAVCHGDVGADETAVVINTGNGLKDVAAAMQAVDLTGPDPVRIRPDLDSLAPLVERWEI